MNKLSIVLTPRDRKIVLGAIPVVVLLVLALGIRTLGNERRQVNDELDLVLEDIAWLQTQSGSLAGLNQACQASPWSNNVVSRLASRHQVSVVKGSEGEDLMLDVSADNGNQVINWLRDLECQGARVEQLTLETSDEGAVKGRVVLQLPVT